MKKKIIILSTFVGAFFLFLINLTIFLGSFISLKYQIEEIKDINILSNITHSIFNELLMIILLDLLSLIVLCFLVKGNKRVRHIVIFSLFALAQIGFCIDKYLVLKNSFEKLDINTVVYHKIYPTITILSVIMFFNLILFIIILIVYQTQKK